MKQDLRQSYIDAISSLYPADSDYADTAKIGQGLILKAIFYNWRELPEGILREYARQCELLEQQQQKRNYYWDEENTR